MYMKWKRTIEIYGKETQLFRKHSCVFHGKAATDSR